MNSRHKKRANSVVVVLALSILGACASQRDLSEQAEESSTTTSTVAETTTSTSQVDPYAPSGNPWGAYSSTAFFVARDTALMCQVLNNYSGRPSEAQIAAVQEALDGLFEWIALGVQGSQFFEEWWVTIGGLVDFWDAYPDADYLPISVTSSQILEFCSDSTFQGWLDAGGHNAAAKEQLGL
jgi:hypothetical protein